jgi:hypothetical protein
MGNLRSLAVVITIACLAAAAGSAGAGTIFVEHFAGTDGTALTTYDSDYVMTANGGNLAGRKAEIDSPGLTVSGKLSSGNSLYIGVPDSGSPVLTYKFTNDNDLTNQNPGDSSVYYASALFKVDQFGTDTSAALYVELPFYREGGAGTVREVEFGLFLQTPINGGGLRVMAAKEQNWVDFADYTAGSTVQVVLKTVVGLSGSNPFLAYYAAVDPLVGVEPTWQFIAQTETNAAGWNLDAVSVAAYAPNNASFGWIDEVRVGTTYDDVVVAPEPATLALLALGGMGLLARRKK